MASQATSALGLVEVSPPPGRVETIPPRPDGADAWVDGEWLHRRGRWFWLLGHWVKVPPGATFRPWVFVRASDGSGFYAPSVWVDDKGQRIDPPHALAYATATGMGIISPDGDPEATGRAIKTAPTARQRPAAETPPSPASEDAGTPEPLPSASTAPSASPPPAP